MIPTDTPDGLRRQNELLKAELEREKCERQLEAGSSALMRLITDNVADLIAVVDTQGRRIWNNQSYHTTLGYSPEEIAGTDSLIEIHPEDLPHVVEVFRESIQTGVGKRIRYRMKHKRGHWVLLESNAKVVRNHDNKVECIILVARDIGITRQSEDDLLQTRKMESMASVFGHVAGELNNLLTVQMANLSMARLLTKPNSETSKYLSDAVNAATRSQVVVSQLFSLSAEGAGGTPNVQGPSSNVILDPLIRELALEVVPSGANARFEYGNKCRAACVVASRPALKEALKNLLNNALESMDAVSHRGIIRVDQTIEVVHAGDTTAHHLSPGEYVVLRIRDQGCGIPEHLIHKVFDPYYSTKEGHQGLGLSYAFSTISKLHGTILISSQERTSTLVTVFLPVVHGTSRETGSIPVLTPGFTAAHKVVPKRILLMDDEKFVRDFVAAMLEQHGYVVTSTVEGSETISEFTKALTADQPYDLIILDLLVPEGVGGESAFAVLRSMQADVKAIATTGYPNHHIMQDPGKYGFSGSIAKPFKMDQLEAEIKRVLGI